VNYASKYGISSREQILSIRFLAIEAGARRSIRWYWHVFRGMSLESFKILAPKKWMYHSNLHMKPQNCFVWKNTNLKFCRIVQSLLQQYGFVTGSVNLSTANLLYRCDSLNGQVNVQNNRYWSAHTPKTEVKFTKIINQTVLGIFWLKLNSVFSSLFVVKYVSELNEIISNICSIRQQMTIIQIL